MFGYRARIGYISPSVIELNAYDFYRIVPDGVGLIAVACMVEGWKEDAYKKALSQVESCARDLARRSCDFVIHGGAPLVLSQGKGFETKLLAQLREITGVPCTTSIVAAMDAFRDLSATRLAVVDPYPPDLNAKMTGYLQDWGFEVESLVSLGTSFTDSSIASIGEIYRAAKRAIREGPKAQAAFIPCQLSSCRCYRGYRNGFWLAGDYKHHLSALCSFQIDRRARKNLRLREVDANAITIKLFKRSTFMAKIRSVVTEGNRESGYRRVQVLFGTNYFLEIVDNDGRIDFLLGAHHTGFRADASELQGELHKYITEVQQRHPESSFEQE